MLDVQKRMQGVLERAVADGRERGVQLAVYRDGKLIVDAWAGVADPATGRLVDGQTLFPVFSVTKGMAATLMHMLVERGRISYETRVIDVWPEFAAEGKGQTTLRHLLCHASGLPLMPRGIGYLEMVDWPRMCNEMAKMRPQWPAGSRMVYHAVTFSWLVGEVIRRVGGGDFRQQLHEEIAAPLGIADSMFAGIPDEVEPRVAILEQIFATPPVFPDDSAPQAIPGWIQPLHTMMNRPDARRACIPASNGIMTARALARHYAALLPGGVDGVELLPPSRIALATQLQEPGDPVRRMSLGYKLGGEGDMGPRPTAFGHDGYGGSLGFADPEKRLAVGLTKNLYSTNPAHSEILRELRAAIDNQ